MYLAVVAAYEMRRTVIRSLPALDEASARVGRVQWAGFPDSGRLAGWVWERKRGGPGWGRPVAFNACPRVGTRIPRVVSQKQLELFFLCFAHSRARATWLDSFQSLLAATQLLHD